MLLVKVEANIDDCIPSPGINLELIPGFIYLDQVRPRQKYYAPQVWPYQAINDFILI